MSAKSKIYNRTQELRERLNSFFKKITNSEIEIFEKLTLDDLIKLKLALSDVNNESNLFLIRFISKK